MKNRCVYLLFVMLTGVLMSAEIQSGIETEDQWRFEATPYFWFLSIDGDATMDGVTGDVDLKFDDLFDLFNYGGALRLDAYKGKWGFKADIVMVDLGEDFKGPFGNKAEAHVRQWAADFTASYQVLSVPMDDAGSRTLTLAPYGGFRYNYLKQKVRLPAPIGTVGDSQDWVDLLVGVATKMDLTEKLTAGLEADIGGFGIGSSSDLAWQVITGFNYSLSDQIDLKFGYRYFNIDYSRGSGNKEFGIDAAYSGPFTGLTFKW